MIAAYYEARGWTAEGRIPDRLRRELGVDDPAFGPAGFLRNGSETNPWLPEGVMPGVEARRGDPSFPFGGHGSAPRRKEIVRDVEKFIRQLRLTSGPLRLPKIAVSQCGTRRSAQLRNESPFRPLIRRFLLDRLKLTILTLRLCGFESSYGVSHRQWKGGAMRSFWYLLLGGILGGLLIYAQVHGVIVPVPKLTDWAWFAVLIIFLVSGAFGGMLAAPPTHRSSRTVQVNRSQTMALVSRLQRNSGAVSRGHGRLGRGHRGAIRDAPRWQDQDGPPEVRDHH